jgi:hypothetical protein
MSTEASISELATDNEQLERTAAMLRERLNRTLERLDHKWSARPPEASIPSLEAEHEELERTASILRDTLTSTLQQLERRWKNMFNVEQQIRNHPLPFILAGSATLLTFAGCVRLAVAAAHRRNSLSSRLRKNFDRLQHRLASI